MLSERNIVTILRLFTINQTAAYKGAGRRSGRRGRTWIYDWCARQITFMVVMIMIVIVVVVMAVMMVMVMRNRTSILLWDGRYNFGTGGPRKRDCV